MCDLSLDKAVESKDLRRLVMRNKFTIALQLLDRVESLHERGYVHADIKTENVCLDILKNGDLKLTLIDFGLAHEYTNRQGAHIEKKFMKGFIGNIPFASLNSCRLVCKSRRDDFEAIFYLLILIQEDFKLPWQAQLDEYSKKEQEDVELAIKNYTTQRLDYELIKRTITILPSELRVLLKDTYLQEYGARPKYEEFRKIL